jgi:hypothetical protein
MTEKSILNQVIQIGMETTAGTAVAATKRLTGANLTLGPQVDIQKYRPAGFKFPTVNSMSKEWTEGRVEGPVTYTELVYLLNSLIKQTTPTGATAKTWTFSPATYGNDTVRTFTVERGDSISAQRLAHCLFTGLGMRFDRSGATINGSFLGRALQTGFTLSVGTTDIAMVPVMIPEVAVYMADTVAGLTGAPMLDRTVSVEWNLVDRFSPVWTLNRSSTFAASIESEPNLECQLTIQSNSTGLALLPSMRTGATKFLRIEALGRTIGAGPATYELVIDTAVKIMDVSEFEDRDGVETLTYTMGGFHDDTWGKATEVKVINEVATL